MKVAVVGYGVEGRASATYFAQNGHEVTICDKNPGLVVPAELSHQLGDKYLHDLDQFDLIIRSAGIHPAVICAHNPGVMSKITTAVNEFLAHSPTQNIIGITGTKGKGTTSTLTARILEAHGHKVWLGGNIGRSPLEFIGEMQPEDWVVLELSSFQLYDVRHSPHIAACLMVVPEHLDWHEDLDDYYHAKSNLFRMQKSDDVAIYYADSATSGQIASSGDGRLIPYFADPGAKVCEHNQIEIEKTIKICHVDELKLLGKHNWQNVCAAITVAWQAGCQDPEKIKHVVVDFTGLPHRLEFVRDTGGIRYYNDSFAATPDAAIASFSAIPGKKTVILGGFDRGLPLDHLVRALQVHTDSVRPLLIGESAKRLAKLCDDASVSYTLCGKQHMGDIVREAQETAKGGEAIVLSPGFASFDMFKNFEDRGNQFKKVVEAL
ncbi:UDP-N-acetylmuramoyl-L-alanine--D-glutamate ligase [Candidatus Saccharibacteria bacterium]|nr:UDP-N-acetylmuramoyl-L-alanine--D-glutamate ligase [Candidatus Saccharibacteria bacterium]